MIALTMTQTSVHSKTTNRMKMAIDTEDNPDEWFRRRAFAISAHRLEKELELGNDSVSTLSQEIYYPNSTA